MCGIVGIIDFEKNTAGKETILREMCTQIIHRGPMTKVFTMMISLGLE